MKRTWLGMALCGMVGALAVELPVTTVLFQEDFSAFAVNSARQRLQPSGHGDFKQALALTTVLAADGKAMQGAWRGAPFAASGAEILEIDYWIKFGSTTARYALLVNGGSHKAITLVQDGGMLQVSRGMTWSWQDVAPVQLGVWHHLRYCVNQVHGTFDIFVDDMVTPAVAALPYRDPLTSTLDRIWTLGSENAESVTFLGPMTVTARSSGEFPPRLLAQRPYHVSGVPWVAAPPAAADFVRLASPIVLSAPGYDAVVEGATARLLRDTANLYVLFDFVAADMGLRRDEITARDGRVWTDDCFQLFLQPDLGQPVYYHLAGNSAGAVYDSCHRQGQRDDGWQARWTAQISRAATGWSALVTLPFAELGVAAPESDALWGCNVGRENPHSHEVLSWTALRRFHDPGQFGRLLFASQVDERPAAARQQALIDQLFNTGAVLTALAEKAQSDFSDLPWTLQQAYGALRQDVASAKDELSGLTTFSACRIALDEARGLEQRLLALGRDAERARAFFAPGSDAARRGYASMVLSPMTKITDQDTAFFRSEARPYLRLSGREYGSLQVLLLAMPGKPLGGVAVEAAALTDAAGRALAGARCQSYVVDVVRTAKTKQTSVGYADILRPAAAGTFAEPRAMLPIWLDVYLPAETPAGDYRTTLTITPQGCEAMTVPVQISATGLSLPISASLDTAFCFDRSWVKAFYGQEPSKESMTAFWQFILDHRLEPMNLWGGGQDVGVDYLDYCAEHGKTLLFLKINNIRAKAAEIGALVETYRGRLRPIFFGHDEVLMSSTPGALEAMKRDYRDAKELFPDIPRLNTARVDERLFGYVDIWCPLFDHFRADDVVARGAAGEQVWWYPTDYPSAPYANFNLDSPGIDPRVIPLMNWKLGIRGLLYWGLNREWLSNSTREFKLMTDEFIKERGLDWLSGERLALMRDGALRWPEIPWLPYFRSVFNVKSVSGTNGGGNLLYPGPDGQLWPSMRLKNLRDGMQDYEYLVMLKNNAAELKKRGGQDALLVDIEVLLAIDADIVGGATSYTKDPQALLAYRDRVIDMVLRSNAALR